ncbi:MAG: c-type cytochrome [Acidobacteria bacterium]|nr:c-type cytochrome [Acidobacteriota bacterium]
MNSTRKLNIVLLLVFLASLGLNWAARRDPTQPNREPLPEMVRTPRYNAFAPNPNFADGKTLQPPVPGTIPRGYLPLHYTAAKEDALRAGEELQNPLASADAGAAQRGAFVFTNFCLECHGAAGRGDGPVTLRGFPAPPSLLAERALNMKDGQMFHVLTYGQGNMPSYAAQLSREDRWKAILFVRSLQKQAAARTAGGKP